jgi:hypothetical protein
MIAERAKTKPLIVVTHSSKRSFVFTLKNSNFDCSDTSVGPANYY